MGQLVLSEHLITPKREHQAFKLCQSILETQTSRDQAPTPLIQENQVDSTYQIIL